jgi:hypothetical protein
MTSLNHNFCNSESDIFLRSELDSSGKTPGWLFSVADDAAINNPHMPERVTLTQVWADSIDEMRGANVVAMKVA